VFEVDTVISNHGSGPEVTAVNVVAAWSGNHHHL